MSNVFDHGQNGGGGGGEKGDTLLCYFHPVEVLVGVCAQCLRERLLLLLASKQGGGRARVPADGGSYLSARPYSRVLRRVRTGSIVSVLSLGSSFINRLDSSSRHHQNDAVHGDADDGEKNPDGEDDASVTSLDDSFISIKFEDNGKATWVDAQSLLQKQDHAVDDMRTDKAPSAATTTAVVEHMKRGGATRWRKQVVGRLLQLARWKHRAASAAGGKPAACHTAEQQQRSSKWRSGRGWIRSITLSGGAPRTATGPGPDASSWFGQIQSSRAANLPADVLLFVHTDPSIQST